MRDGRDDLQRIMDEALEGMAREAWRPLDLGHINLAEFCRRTGPARQRARTTRRNGSGAGPRGLCGRSPATTVPGGYTGFVDDQPGKGVTNSQVVFDKLVSQGHAGGLTTAEVHVSRHRDLVPPKRRAVESQGSRGQRFQSAPGEAYQMDWGFAAAGGPDGAEGRIACFCMVCHHCGMPYVDLFPNARQENLFIGMLRALVVLGVPEPAPADDMASVADRRDAEGRPVRNREHGALVECVGLPTRPREPRHPLAKGKVERLVRFVKENFLAGRGYAGITRTDEEALLWCAQQAGRYRRAGACVPSEEHEARCLPAAHDLASARRAELCLCPPRRISFDGFAGYEGRRFGVPYWYEGRVCRVSREGRYLHACSDDMARELAVHEVTLSRVDSVCEGQWSDSQPEELPTQPVTTEIAQVGHGLGKAAFAKFDFERMVG